MRNGRLMRCVPVDGVVALSVLCLCGALEGRPLHEVPAGEWKEHVAEAAREGRLLEAARRARGWREGTKGLKWGELAEANDG